MFDFLHNQVPDPILFSLGPITIYWYGFCIMLGVGFALLVLLKLAKFYKLKVDLVLDLVFYLMLSGIIGARIYDVFLEFPYYMESPMEIFKIWKGGLAIHGGIIAGCLVLWIFAKKQKLNFWKMAAAVVSVMPLAQAFGRWGNYFNNELYGLPTEVSWSIPVLFDNRISGFIEHEFFHPTFLYESLGNLLIFVILIGFNVWMIKTKRMRDLYYQIVFSLYLICYSVLRFSLEFIRIDTTPVFLGLRVPQIASIIIVLLVIIFWSIRYFKTLKQSLKKGGRDEGFNSNKSSNRRDQEGGTSEQKSDY